MILKNSRNFKNTLLSLITAFVMLFSMSYCDSPDEREGENGFTDEELQLFVEAVEQIMPLQQMSQMQVMEEIDDQEDITPEKFQEINQSIQMGAEPEATEEEMDAFEVAMENIEEIQKEFEETLMEAVEETGLSYQRYEEILDAYEEDPELQERIHSILEEQQPQEPMQEQPMQEPPQQEPPQQEQPPIE